MFLAYASVVFPIYVNYPSSFVTDYPIVIWTGNLLNRTLGLLKKNCNSMLAFDSIAAADDNSFKNNVENLVSWSWYHGKLR
jgi:hypothetical protein